MSGGREQRLAENVAAISGALHSDGRYEEAYNAAKDALSGFPGIWNLCARIGIRVTDQEESGTLDFDGKCNWIEFVDRVTGAVLTVLCEEGRGPTDEEIDEIIRSAREESQQ